MILTYPLKFKKLILSNLLIYLFNKTVVTWARYFAIENFEGDFSKYCHNKIHLTAHNTRMSIGLLFPPFKIANHYSIYNMKRIDNVTKTLK